MIKYLSSILLFFTFPSFADMEGGFVKIFNGKDLSGWTVRNGTATYRVEEGAIIGKTTEGSKNTFLCTDKKYGDFELKLQVKLIDDKLNSGVQIRSNDDKKLRELTDPK